MNIINRFLAWIREEGRMGEYLKPYESSRYSWTDKQDYQGIIVPPTASTFADVSFYQARMDWNRYPHQAAIIRLGQNTWKDSEFEYNYSELKRLKKLAGGYWFWDDRQSPETQANIIISMMAGKTLELELFIDVERTYYGVYGGTHSATNIRKMITLIEQAGVKCKEVGTYTGYYYWTDNIYPYCTKDDRAFFAARPLWLAWYATASVVKIPEPWTDWLYWQYGTPVVDWGQPTAEIDANKKNGTFDVELPSDEVISKPYDGVTTITGKRSGWDYTVDVIDPAKARVEMVAGNPLSRPSDVAVQKGASLAYNGGEWDKVSLPIDLSIQNYFVYVPREESAFRPSLLIMGDRTPIVDIVNRANTKHALTGLRYLIRGSEIQPYLYGTEAQYTEGHARTCYGVDEAGFIIVFTCNGLYPNQGLKLFEVAELMWQHGAVNVFDAGGGGDTVRVKDGKVTNIPQDGAVRAVPETFLVYAEVTMATKQIIKGWAVDATKVCSTPKGTQIGTLAVNQAFEGDYTSGADVYNDQWIHIYTPMVGWVVKSSVHWEWVTVEVEPPVEPPPVDPPVPVDDEIEIFVNGELKYHIIGKLQ